MTSHGPTPARPSSLVNRQQSACLAEGAHSTPTANSDPTFSALDSPSRPVLTSFYVDRNPWRGLAARLARDSALRLRQSRRHEVDPGVHLSGRVGHADPCLDPWSQLPSLRSRKPAHVPGVRIAARVAALRCAEGACSGAGEAAHGAVNAL